jgi:hypothetical protein
MTLLFIWLFSGNKHAAISKPDSTASFLHGISALQRLQERHGSLRNSAAILISVVRKIRKQP